GSTDATGLAVSGGTMESNKFDFAGGDWKITKNLTAQYYYAKLEDYYRQHFVGVLHTFPIAEGQAIKTDLRYFKTDADGANDAGQVGYRTSGFTRNGDGRIDNDTWSAAFTYTFGAHALLGGYQSVSDDSNFVQMSQGGLPDKGAGGNSLYLYTDRLIQSFNRAGERTAFTQYSYDFAALGAPGLKASVMYLKGTDIKTTSGDDQKEWERDFSLDYVIQSGTMQGLGFAWRNGVSRSEASRDQDQNRFTVSYSIPLL
ncbi:OprD family outer membrane porin, partial [Pseudomonas sp. P5_A2_2]